MEHSMGHLAVSVSNFWRMFKREMQQSYRVQVPLSRGTLICERFTYALEVNAECKTYPAYGFNQGAFPSWNTTSSNNQF
jgi:hypothetical protein